MLKKTFIVTLTAATLACVPVFAHPADRYETHNDNRPHFTMDMPGRYAYRGEDCDSRFHDQTGPMNDRPGPHFGMGMRPMGFMGNNPDKKPIMGTVSSVNTDKGIISVKNADGNEINIHVNPVTHIFKDNGPAPEQPDAGTIDRSNMRSFNNRRPDEALITDIKKDDWVIINTFNTDTTTVEAAHIFIPTTK
ncbi:MAG: hypothetical protein K6E51_08210 [Treponema sp.]|nr:hypothetical protein [Treponema sp.]